MCGICGIHGPEPVQPDILRAMTDSIRHRGPDSDGHFIDRGVGLGVRRLSIIDVAGGDQPISSEDGRIVVILNGEIYNYRELREKLLRQGHTFRTRSDTEVLVHLYEELGADFPSVLEGMYAIAVYDRPRGRLLLVRDRMGKKPLYYAHTSRGLLFGSEVKPLLRADPSLARIRTEMLRPLLRFGFVPEPDTLFAGVRKLPPGSILECDGGTPAIRTYWDLRFRPEERGLSRRHYADELDRLLQDAVRRRLVSEVPLGALLSGGPDSSLVAAYMSRQLGPGVPTFTIAFAEAAYDESSAARRAAEYLGTDHHVKLLSLDKLRASFFDDVDAIVRHTDEPIGDSSALPTYHVCRLARDGVKVILGGDGADEILAGYTIFQGVRFAQRYQGLPLAMRNRLIEPLVDRWIDSRPRGSARWAAHVWGKRLADSSLPFRDMLASKFSIASSAETEQLLAPLDRSGASPLWPMPPSSDLADLIPLGDGSGTLDQVQYAVTRFQQVNDMLVKIDRMSMAHSLEMRSPFLDYHLVEFAARLPWRMKLRGRETKSLLREVAARYLPRENAHKKKHGFTVPISLWFRRELYPELSRRLHDSPAIRTYLAGPPLSRILEEHRDGLRDHGPLLWCLLTLDAWHRAYLEPGT
jgi:asparagine synthase (glutamine-hydrolysing)